MTLEGSRQEVLEAVRTRLLRPGAVTEGFSAVDVVAEADGRPVCSVDEWVLDVGSFLMEELDTGLVRRGRRTVREGHVLLDNRDAPDIWPAEYFISPVPIDDDLAPSSASPPESGSWLAGAGLDVGVPRQLIAEARLACWFQAYVNNDRGEPFVGHAAGSWEDGRRTVARLDVVHLRPGVPSEVGEALARPAVCEVAEAGALGVVTAIDAPELRGLGFRPADGGGLTLHTRIGA
ncbi:hypothetical protein [Nonomuraea zeae]|uniref:hypothetical protein n=1 Tax=Nonomuraea zeae TaxID=1642303 RepID=UPI001F1129FB|nr:hypothetical protein [Nonomuraea zeae]